MQGAELAAAEQAATSTKQEMEALARLVGQRLTSLQVPTCARLQTLLPAPCCCSSRRSHRLPPQGQAAEQAAENERLTEARQSDMTAAEAEVQTASEQAAEAAGVEWRAAADERLAAAAREMSRCIKELQAEAEVRALTQPSWSWSAMRDVGTAAASTKQQQPPTPKRSMTNTWRERRPLSRPFGAGLLPRLGLRHRGCERRSTGC